MSYRWRRARIVEECGAVNECRIQPGEPLCEQWIQCNPDTPGNRPLKRCQTHAAVPVPDDLPELDAVDAALNLTPSQIRPVRPASELPFDAKAAAANDQGGE